jgi:hypothetical protein
MAWRWLGQDDDELLEEIRGLRKEIVEIEARKAAIARDVELSDEVVRLKRDISDLKIDKSRIEEDHAKQERELRHMIGLEKKRQEVELVQGTQAAVLKVREENLAADKKRFEDQMTFQQQRFEAEVRYLKDMMGDILARLPNVNVALDGKAGRKA